MTDIEIRNFDPGKMPDATDQTSFHLDAEYVFNHLASDVIPDWNEAIDWINSALVGDTATILDSLAALQVATAPNSAKLGGLTASQFLRSDDGNPTIIMGSNTSVNFDGVKYDERDNSFGFYADQAPDSTPFFIIDKEAGLSFGGDEVWHEGNLDPSNFLGKTAKAADANKLDGLDSSQFVRKDQDTVINGDITVNRLRILISSDVSQTSTPHGFQIGQSNGQNLRFDTNEIICVDDGEKQDFFIHGGGGIIGIHGEGVVKINGDLVSHSGQGVNERGTYAFLDRGPSSASNDARPGEIFAGGGLYYTSRSGDRATFPLPTGSWKCMGYSGNFDRGTLFKKVAN